MGLPVDRLIPLHVPPDRFERRGGRLTVREQIILHAADTFRGSKHFLPRRIALAEDGCVLIGVGGPSVSSRQSVLPGYCFRKATGSVPARRQTFTSM
jgi:hypothetical protein